MSRLVNKLVKQAGGWEAFLYSTLKDVVDKVGLNGFTGEGEEAVADAREIIEVYEKSIDSSKVQMNQVPSPQVKSVVEDVSKVKAEVNPVSQPEESKAESEKNPLPPPKAQRGVLNVDSYAGACQGELPIPDGHKMVNREAIYVATTTGLELGRSAEDGQIRGKGVSGHVNLSGVFRLVFTEADMGTAIMHYQIQQQEA